MAAHAYEGPVAVHEAVAPPTLSVKVAPAAGVAPVAEAKRTEEDTPAPEQDEEEGGVWDSASLYEEILDDVEAFEYSADGTL
jgi:NAD-dependent histone deacetylase SIR2